MKITTEEEVRVATIAVLKELLELYETNNISSNGLSWEIRNDDTVKYIIEFKKKK